VDIWNKICINQSYWKENWQTASGSGGGRETGKANWKRDHCGWLWWTDLLPQKL